MNSAVRLLFCADPFNPREVDADYRKEVAAAGAAGIASHLVDIGALRGNDPEPFLHDGPGPP